MLARRYSYVIFKVIDIICHEENVLPRKTCPRVSARLSVMPIHFSFSIEI